MSMGATSDPAATGEGFGGQGSPAMPDLTGQPVPMDGAGFAIESQPGDASVPPEAAEGVAFSDDDLAFLQSDEVRQWFAQNKPQGFWTEQEFQQHKAELQRQLNTQSEVRVQQATRQAEEQMGIAAAQTEALVAALYQAWQNEGLEPNTPDWQQREQQIAAFAKSKVDQRKLQTYEGQRERSASVAGYAKSAYDELRAWGVDTENNAAVKNAVRDHLVAIQQGRYQDPGEIARAQSELVRRMVTAAQQPQQPSQQPAVQQQPAAAAPAPAQTAAPQRPNFGPMRSVQGAGGPGARSEQEMFEAGQKRLIEQYGGDITKVPLSEWNKLDLEVSMQAYG